MFHKQFRIPPTVTVLTQRWPLNVYRFGAESAWKSLWSTISKIVALSCGRKISRQKQVVATLKSHTIFNVVRMQKRINLTRKLNVTSETLNYYGPLKPQEEQLEI